MKTVTTAFMDAWRAKQGKGAVLYVQYKRRNLNGSAFVYDSSWTQFTMRDFIEVGNITQKLDTPLLNDFKSSNVTIKFKNSDYQFLPSNFSTGLAQPDGVSSSGYEMFLMKYRVLFGYKLADGTIETVSLFTGVCTDMNFLPQEGAVEVFISGNEALLQFTSARGVATALTAAATTNTSGNNWQTNATGIAHIETVYDDGVELTQGTDYTISGLGALGDGATIALSYVAIGAVTYDGASWKTLQLIEDLVTDLVELAGIESYNISPVIFAGSSGAVVTPIGVFSGSSYSPTWTSPTSFGSGSVSASGGVLRWGSGSGAPVPSWMALQTVNVVTLGLFTFDSEIFSMSGAGSSNGGDGAVIMFLQTVGVTNGGVGPILTGYGLRFNLNYNAGLDQQLQLVRFDGENTNNGTVLVNLGLFEADGSHEYAISRSTSGVMQVYRDGFLLGTSSPDNTYTTTAYFATAARMTNTGSSIEINIGSIQNTTAVQLSLANFSGMTCYDAIQSLAKLVDYEWGFDGEGSMFFRSKTPASLTPIAEFSQSDGISKIVSMRPGWGGVKNNVQLTYGEYFREYSSTTAGEAQPTSQQRYKDQLLIEDLSGFLLAYDPIIANARVQSIRDSYYRAMRECTFSGKIIPFADLSDVLNWSYYNNPRMADNIFGDPLEKWGMSAFGVPLNVLGRNVPGKIIGLTFNPNTCEGTYETQEVLS